jgi:cytochrome b6-f complex iron-sulfur subunit
MVKQSRRTFIILAKTAFVALLLFLWNKLTLNHLKAIDKKARILPLNMNKTISFHGDYIVLNNEGITTVLTSHCTHLGCKINEVKNGKLICPCHGSQYDLDGNPIKGPAFKALKKVPSKVSLDKTTIEVTG